MIYCNTPLASTSKSPMQMLQQRSARSQLPMSNVARRQLGIVAEQWPTNKNQHLTSHDFHIGQDVMCQSPATRRMVPCYNQSSMSRTQKLPDRNSRRDHIQKDTKPYKAIQVSPKDWNKRTISAAISKPKKEHQLMKIPKRHSHILKDKLKCPWNLIYNNKIIWQVYRVNQTYDHIHVYIIIVYNAIKHKIKAQVA